MSLKAKLLICWRWAWRMFTRLLLVSVFLTSLVMLFVVMSFNGTDDGGSYDCGVVFGAAVHRGGTAGPGIARRVRTAVQVYEQGRVTRWFFTGGKADGSPASEAKVMADFAAELGLPAENIVLEQQASSTQENLLFTKALLADCERILGISDRYHLARIRFLAWQQGGWGNLKVLPSAQSANALFELQSVLREVLALMYYAVLGIHEEAVIVESWL